MSTSRPVVPQQSVPLVTPDGRATRPLYDFMLAVQRRIGGVGGFTNGNILVGTDEGDPEEIAISAGDVTFSSGVLTISNNAVTFAKLQDIATNRLLGRATAGSGDVEQIDLTAAGRALLDDANAAAQRVTLGLEIGANVQAWSANLDEYAAVNPTVAGLALLDDANAAAQRTTLGLAIGSDVQAHSANTAARAGTAGASGAYTFDATNPGSVTSLTVSNGLITAATTL